MKKTKAFSLIELTISLITISCILAAFSPIISKKLKTTNASISSLGVKSHCDKISTDCKLCNSTKCLVCSKVCPNDSYKDISSCTCIPCSTISPYCNRCSSEKCLSCKSGYGLTSTNQCKPCQKGYYSNGLSDCSPCPAGKYQNEITQESCKEVPIGNYTNSQASVNYTPCPIGQYQNMTGQKECIPCPVGQYQNKTGQIICKDCPEGKYQDTTQATQCKTCTEGNWSELGSDKCYVCTDDKPCGGGNNAECPLGYYKSVGSNQCTKCSDTYSNCLICSSENCIQCNVGFELKDNKCKAGCLIDFCEDCPNPSKCEKCKEGYYIQENGTCSNDFCVAPDFVKIQAGGISYCVTRRNMGDLITTNSNPSNIKLYDCSGHNCESKVCSCMSTSSDSNCNVAYANYSGCSRTVGNQKYGIEICKNFNYANKNWYLPSESELLNIFNVAIKDQKNSLQLCLSSNIGQYYPQCNCDRTWTNYSWDTCDSSGCRPWARSIYYEKGSATRGLEYKDALNSVRCITKL